MKEIKITDELIALYLSGQTTLEQTFAVIKAAKADPEIASLIDVEEEGDSTIIPMSNPASEPVCRVIEMRTRFLAVERRVAKCINNDCVIKCEHEVLRSFEKATDIDKLTAEARKKGWLKEDGVSLFNIGRLLELSGLSVARRFFGDLPLLMDEMKAGCQIIVAICQDRLLGKKDQDYKADHAVLIKNISIGKNMVELFDPKATNGTISVPIITFLAAWACSNHYLVSIIRRGIRPYTPHPENVSIIVLPKEIEAIADMLAENAHEEWAYARLSQGWTYGPMRDEQQKKSPFMLPYSELAQKDKATDYTTALNTLKLLIKIGYQITKDESRGFSYQTNARDEEGRYIPHPIDVSGTELPQNLLELTEYIAENAHEEWAQKRQQEGWTYGTDKAKKQTTDMVPYCELLEVEKEYDRTMAMKTVRVLLSLGYKIMK